MHSIPDLSLDVPHSSPLKAFSSPSESCCEIKPADAAVPTCCSGCWWTTWLTAGAVASSRSGWRATWPAAAVVPASCPGLASCRWSWLAVAALVSCCSRLCSPTWPLQLPLSPLVEAFLTRFEASCNSSFFLKKTVNSTVFLTCLHSKGNSLFLSAACSPDVCEAKVWGPVVFSASTTDLRVFQMTSFYLNKQHEIHGMNSIVLFYTFFKH